MEQIGLPFREDLTYRKGKYRKKAKAMDQRFQNWVTVDTDSVDCKSCGAHFVDLFAGAGGLALGLKQAGFDLLFSVEKVDYAVDTLRHNFPEGHHWHGDIQNFEPRKHLDKDEVDLVVGGPPCQGFSLAGRRDAEDHRNFLFRHFLKVVRYLEPVFIIMENVPGIITLDDGKFFDTILNSFYDIGYEVTARVLESADYGVPQLRARTFFIANNLGIDNPYPKTLYKPAEYKPIDSAIEDLEDRGRDPSTNHIWTNHSQKMIKRISEVGPGESLYDTYRDAYKRQREGQPSMTIKENHGGTHIHYKLDRCISVREMARIQTFPDDFFFAGSHKKGFIQVGNAVPPLLAKHVGLAVKSHM